MQHTWTNNRHALSYVHRRLCGDAVQGPCHTTAATPTAILGTFTTAAAPDSFTGSGMCESDGCGGGGGDGRLWSQKAKKNDV